MPRLILTRVARRLRGRAEGLPTPAPAPMLSFATSPRRSALLAVIVAAAGAMHASPALAQDAPADSLAQQLTTTDIHQRALAVARLNALPLDSLTPRARAALVALLDAEATKREPLDSEQLTEEDETYDEYIIDLTDAVLKLHDPASLRGLTLLGIQTGQDVQRWIASQGASSLPALDEAWRAEPAARPTIVTTWAFELALTGPNALGSHDRQTVLGSILAATGDHPIAVASAARIASLVALAPALSDLAAGASSDVVRSRAAKAVEVLAPLRGARTPLQVLEQARELVDGFCLVPGAAHPPTPAADRATACGQIRGKLAEGRAGLVSGRSAAARAALVEASDRAAAARAQGVFTPAEAAVVEGNVQYLLGRI